MHANLSSYFQLKIACLTSYASHGQEAGWRIKIKILNHDWNSDVNDKSDCFYYDDLNQIFSTKTIPNFFLLFTFFIILCVFVLYLNQEIIKQEMFILGWTRAQNNGLLKKLKQ